MIIERIGDIFKQDDITCIAHQCNLHHTMGGGIARIIAEKFPEAKEADDNTPLGAWSKLGTVSVGLVYDLSSNISKVFNIYSQIGIGNVGTVIGRNTQYDKLVDGFECIKQEMKYPMFHALPQCLGIPYGLGSDLAGGSWTIVRAIIESSFRDAYFDVVICRLPNAKELF